jgi:signal transduction histidine kinase
MPGVPVYHPIRLEALKDTGLLDSLSEESYDRFTRLACAILKADLSLISLVDDERQFFKSSCGLREPHVGLRQTDLSRSFCRHVVEGGEPFVVENAYNHPMVQLNPSVTELGVVSYLGMPITTPDGYVLGSLCAIGHSPRNWTDEDLSYLSDLAAAVSREIELSQQTHALNQELYHAAEIHHKLENELRTIVHDLRTPAGAVSSCLELLSLSEDDFSDETLELLDVSRESTQQMLHMVQQILQEDHRKVSGNIAPEDVHPTSVTQLLRHITRVIQPSAMAALVKVEVSWPNEMICIRVSERLIERVFLNILNNAVKYSPPGGTVKICVQRSHTSDHPMCHIAVIDHGPGVPDTEKTEIFEEYAVGSSSCNYGVQSFGIGLAFCKNVVTAHGGQIGVEDTPGGGSTFYCMLPCTR